MGKLQGSTAAGRVRGGPWRDEQAQGAAAEGDFALEAPTAAVQEEQGTISSLAHLNRPSSQSLKRVLTRSKPSGPGCVQLSSKPTMMSTATRKVNRFISL